MKQALLIIDIQNDYFEGGKMTVKDADKAAEHAAMALQYCRSTGIHVVHIQHIDVENLLPFFQPNTFGVEIHELVKPTGGEAHFVKHTPNAFYQTGLLRHLQDHAVTNLAICGMMTHMCVDATVRAAKDYGFTVRLLADACATTDMLFDGEIIKADFVQNSFLGALGQYYAEIISTSNFIL